MEGHHKKEECCKGCSVCSRICLITAVGIILLLAVSAGIYTFVKSSKDKATFNEAIATMNSGNLAKGLEQCDNVENDRNRGFCYVLYLNFKKAAISRQFETKYGAGITEEQNQQLQREINKEYGLVCGIEPNAPYLAMICSGR